MTKAELIEALRDYHHDDIIVINVHDTELFEDEYDFYIDSNMIGRQLDRGLDKLVERHEIYITPINHRHYNP